MRSNPVLVCLIVFAAGACESETTVATDPAEENALRLSVMTARGDTLTAPVENEIVDLPPLPEVVSARKPAEPVSAPQLEAAPPVIVAERPPSQKPRAIQAEHRDRDKASSRTGTIASGTSLALVTNDRPCSAHVAIGNTFGAIVTNRVRGSSEAVIPAGAQAVAEITSVDKWGAGVGIRVKSVRVDGRSYPVNSRVTYVVPVSGDEGACIAQRTHIDVETREPLRIATGS